MSMLHEIVGRVVFKVGTAAFAASDRIIARFPCLGRWFDARVRVRPGYVRGVRGYGVGRF